MKKDFMKNHAAEILEPVTEWFEKWHGNLYSKSSHATINIHAEEGDQILFVCPVFNCNVWPNPSNINDFKVQLAVFQKLFERYKGINTCKCLMLNEITESVQAIICCSLNYFTPEIVNQIDFFGKDLTLKRVTIFEACPINKGSMPLYTFFQTAHLRVCSAKWEFVQVKSHSFLQGWNLPFLREPPLSGYPPLSEANLKSYPIFLRAIQIGVCKLHETIMKVLHFVLY